MYESLDKDEEGKRQGTRKSEADEEDDDYPAANSLDLIKLCFSLSGCFFFSLLPFFFLLFSSSPSVACCGMGWPGWRGRLWSFVCRLKRIHKRIATNTSQAHFEGGQKCFQKPFRRRV